MSRLKLPKYDRPVRYLCTHCGAWREGDANRLIVAGITGYEPGDPDARQTASAQQAEMPFLDRHGKTCHATIRIICPDSPDWEKLHRDKRED
jgi:hypothetical protein